MSFLSNDIYVERMFCFSGNIRLALKNKQQPKPATLTEKNTDPPLPSLDDVMEPVQLTTFMQRTPCGEVVTDLNDFDEIPIRKRFEQAQRCE